MKFINTILFTCGSLMALTLASPTYLIPQSPAVPALQDTESFSNTAVESRELMSLVGTVLSGAITAINTAIATLQKKIDKDNSARTGFTQDFVANMAYNDPTYNYVICHVKHKYKFDGQKDVDWGHLHRELDIKVGGTIGYEIYWFKSGTFTRLGDGGYINWAWKGRAKFKSLDGRTIIFSAP